MEHVTLLPEHEIGVYVAALTTTKTHSNIVGTKAEGVLYSGEVYMGIRTPSRSSSLTTRVRAVVSPVHQPAKCTE